MKKKECYSFHDFMVGRDYNVKPTPIISAAETMYAFDMVIQATQSTAVMIIGSTSTSATLAVVTAALLRNLPVININIDENVLDVTISKAITTMSFFFGKRAFIDMLDFTCVQVSRQGDKKLK